MTTQNEMKDLSVQEKRELKAEESTRSGLYFEPSVDIYETASSLTLIADVSGIRSENLEVNIRDSVLTLNGHVKELDERWKPIYEEYRIGHYTRQFKLGHQIDQAKITAVIKDGVLTLTLPKAEAAHPRRIQVQTVP
jgi:HSP20 family molecular chaperone IbpA